MAVLDTENIGYVGLSNIWYVPAINLDVISYTFVWEIVKGRIYNICIDYMLK